MRIVLVQPSLQSHRLRYRSSHTTDMLTVLPAIDDLVTTVGLGLVLSLLTATVDQIHTSADTAIHTNTDTGTDMTVVRAGIGHDLDRRGVHPVASVSPATKAPGQSGAVTLTTDVLCASHLIARGIVQTAKAAGRIRTTHQTDTDRVSMAEATVTVDDLVTTPLTLNAECTAARQVHTSTQTPKSRYTHPSAALRRHGMPQQQAHVDD
jgi:hypothetical protein